MSKGYGVRRGRRFAQYKLFFSVFIIAASFLVQACDPNTPQPKPKPANAVSVESIIYNDGKGHSARDTAIGSLNAEIRGVNFSATAEDNTVVFTVREFPPAPPGVRPSKDSYLLKTMEVKPTLATANSLQVQVPATHHGDFIVKTPKGVSEKYYYQRVNVFDPMLFDFDESLVIKVGDTVKVYGRNLWELDRLDIGETETELKYRLHIGGIRMGEPQGSGNDYREYLVPAAAKTNTWQIHHGTEYRTGPIANIVKHAIQTGTELTVTLPAGSPLALNELKAGADLQKDTALDSNGKANISVAVAGLDYVFITAADGQGDYLALGGVSRSDETTLTVDAYSTAKLMTLLSVRRVLLQTPANQIDFLSKVGYLSQVTALGELLKVKLAANPRFLMELDAEYINLQNSAVAAADKLLDLASRPSVPVGSAGAPVITPSSQAQTRYAKVYPLLFSGDTHYSGDIGVSNGSHVYLSAKITANNSGETLYNHITSYMDPKMVNAKGTGVWWELDGAVLRGPFKKEDFKLCAFQDCSVEIFTPNSDNPVGLQLYSKTLVEKIFFPILEFALDNSKFKSKDLAAAIVNVAKPALEASWTASKGGDPKKALGDLTKHIMNDFTQKGGGPILKEVLRRAGYTWEEAVEKAISKKILTRVIPGWGQIKAGADIIAIGKISGDIGKVHTDLGGVAPVINYNVVWPMYVYDTDASEVLSNHGELLFRFYGSGLDKVQSIHLKDQSNVAHFTILTPAWTSTTQDAMRINIPGEYIANAVGPISFVLEGDNKFFAVEQTLTVKRGLEINSISPTSVKRDENISISVSGLDALAQPRVRFASAGGSVYSSNVSFNSVAGLITARVPASAVTGYVFVEEGERVARSAARLTIVIPEPAKPCGVPISANGGYNSREQEFEIYLGENAGKVQWFYEAYRIPDSFRFEWPNGSTIKSSGGYVSGYDTDYFRFDPERHPHTAILKVKTNDEGTGWAAGMSCPGRGLNWPVTRENLTLYYGYFGQKRPSTSCALKVWLDGVLIYNNINRSIRHTVGAGLRLAGPHSLRYQVSNCYTSPVGDFVGWSNSVNFGGKRFTIKGPFGTRNGEHLNLPD